MEFPLLAELESQFTEIKAKAKPIDIPIQTIKVQIKSQVIKPIFTNDPPVIEWTQPIFQWSNIPPVFEWPH